MEKLGKEMWDEAMAIKYNAQSLAWYMRGGIQYSEILNMCAAEIANLNKIIDGNLETTKKSNLPFF